MLLRNIFESIARTGQGKTAVVGWGRGMGHKGHMMLASSVITQADKVGGDPYFVVSKTVGKDDPIMPDEKIAIYKKVFPQSGHIFQPATDELPDLTRVLANLNQQGYTSVTVVLGADQVKAFQYLKNYNNKPDKSGNILYNFDNLDVISRQETGDPSAGEEGPRATPMRQVLMDPSKSEQEQFAVWRDAMSPEVSDDEVRDLMAKAKQRMSDPAFGKKPKVKEVKTTAAVKLGKAWDQQKQKSDASRERAAQAKAEFEKQWAEKQKSVKQEMNEDVGGNYLYHSVRNAEQAKGILSSGYFEGSTGAAQDATDAQTNLPTVSFGRNLDYQINGGSTGRDYKAIFVIDRAKLESKYKTLGTSQNKDVRGLANTNKFVGGTLKDIQGYDVDKNGKLTKDDADAVFQAVQKDPNLRIGNVKWEFDPNTKQKRAPTRQEVGAAMGMEMDKFGAKKGHEYEEVVPTKTGKIPWQGMLLGFYIVPGKGLEKDPELMSSPWRLDMPSPNTFVKANKEPDQQQTPMTFAQKQAQHLAGQQRSKELGTAFKQAKKGDAASYMDLPDNQKRRIPTPQGVAEDMSRRGFLRGAGALAVGSALAGGARADEKSDPNKLIAIVNIDGESKEFNLTGKFKGDVRSQLHQAEDFITEFLEKRDINFSNLELRYQGAVLKTQNTGSVRKDEQSVSEKMMPASNFSGSKKNKLGTAGQWRNDGPSKNRPARSGDLVGGASESIEEGFGSKLAGLGLAGALALGGGHAQAGQDLGNFATDYLQKVASGDHPRPMVSIDDAKAELQLRANGKQQTVTPEPSNSKSGFSKEWLQKAADPNRTGRYMISVEKAQELLSKMNAVDEAKKKGVDGKACWDGYRYNGTENGSDKCVKVSEDVQDIMDALINKIIVNEAIQNNRR